ncbi:flavin reductase family protein [Streptomyces sp. NPDC088147]|uniref:flavin reductase family protein n=1 Tax=unclassified Streptomyces TaxID=2593676 RepID=UPI0033A18368
MSVELRRVLGTFASGVVAVTAIHDEKPVGMVCQSFSSLSLDPPLVLFCPGEASTSWPKIRAAGRFAINVLAADQRRLCEALAGPRKFDGLDWRPGVNGAPLLPGALSWIEADLADELAGGDHSIAVGAVTALTAEGDGAPLLFFRSSFGTLTSVPGGSDRVPRDLIGALSGDRWF